MVTKIWEFIPFKHKISYNSAYIADMAKNLTPNSLKHGVFMVALFKDRP